MSLLERIKEFIWDMLDSYDLDIKVFDLANITQDESLEDYFGKCSLHTDTKTAVAVYYDISELDDLKGLIELASECGFISITAADTELEFDNTIIFVHNRKAGYSVVSRAYEQSDIQGFRNFMFHIPEEE